MAGLADGDIVLDADADAFPAIVDLRLTLRHAEAITDVKARLHREHHARLQRSGLLTEPISPHVMHIQSQPMAGAMHVQMPVVAPVDDSVHVPDQQAQIHQPFHKHAQGLGVNRLRGASWGHDSNRGLLRFQHKAVKLPLFRRETAIHGEGAGDITVVVVLQRTAGIDQEQIAVLKRSRVGGVVQHAGVIAAGHDGAIGGAAGPMAAEVRLHRRLHLGLVHARAGDRSRQLMGFGRDPAGLP